MIPGAKGKEFYRADMNSFLLYYADRAENK